MPRAAPQPHDFRHPELAGFVDQVRYASERVRLDQLHRAEQLHDELEPDTPYPVAFLIFRITRHQPAQAAPDTVPGEAARHDLRLVIDLLSRSLDLAPRADDFTQPSLCEHWGVSRRTLGRLRDRGLRWRMVRGGAVGGAKPTSGGRRVVRFPALAVADFERRHGAALAAASSFQRLGDDEKSALIGRARRIVAAWHERRRGHELTRQAVIDHLARRGGRAGETLRQLFERHDRAAEPGERVFDVRAAMTASDWRDVRRSLRAGVSLRELARRYQRSGSALRRHVQQRRLAATRRINLAHHRAATFDRDDAEAVLLGRPALPPARDDLDHAEARRLASARVAGVEPDPMFTLTPLTADAARRLAVRLNYLKHRAARCREEIDPLHPAAGELDRFARWVHEAGNLRDELVRRHLPTLRSVVERQLDPAAPDRDTRRLDLLSLGLLELIETVDQHDPFHNRSLADVVRNRLLRRFASHRPPPPDPQRAHRRVNEADIAPRLHRLAATRQVRLLA